MPTSPIESERTFRSRPFRRGFSGLSRHWFAGRAVPTHLFNAINLLFPAGERFFIRSVRAFEASIQDPELRRQIREFYAQEGRHAHAHERYFETLREQGYQFLWAIRFIEWLLHRAAPRILPAEIRLSITVALEHYTAIMAELPFEHPFFQQIEPTMLELLRWHAAEEIEHKAVAFDVLKQVDPSYRTRMLGYSIATVALIPIWGTITAALLAQDHLSADQFLKELREVGHHKILGEHVFFRAFQEYIARDFHPLSHDTYAMVQSFLEQFEASSKAA